MAKKQKYEVVEYNSGGFFISGGRVGEIYIKEKADADLVCDALNMVERLKTKTVQRKIAEAISALENIKEGLEEGDGFSY